MTRKALFRTIIFSLIILNIINFFFLITSYAGEHLKNGFTFFDYSFIMKRNIENYYGVQATFLSSSNVLLFLPCLIIDIILFLYIYSSRFNNVTSLSEPIRPIFYLSTAGIILHLIYLLMNCPGGNITFAEMIGKGMIGNLIWIFSYIGIMIIISLMLYYEKDDKIVSIRKSDVLCIAIVFELILSFFFFSIVKSFNGHNRLFFSFFEMTYKHDNSFSLEGNVESYPYMWIIFICYFVSLCLTFSKKKMIKIICIFLHFLCIILAFTGTINMLDSYCMNYVSISNHSFFSVVSLSFFIVIIMNVIIILIKSFQMVEK